MQIASAFHIERFSSTIEVSLLEIRRGIALTLANPNSMSHILDSKHGLDLLLSKAGKEANIIRRLYLSLGQSNALPSAGIFQTISNVYGYHITIRGAAVNDVPRIDTAIFKMILVIYRMNYFNDLLIKLEVYWGGGGTRI